MTPEDKKRVAAAAHLREQADLLAEAVAGAEEKLARARDDVKAAEASVREAKAAAKDADTAAAKAAKDAEGVNVTANATAAEMSGS